MLRSEFPDDGVLELVEHDLGSGRRRAGRLGLDARRFHQGGCFSRYRARRAVARRRGTLSAIARRERRDGRPGRAVLATQSGLGHGVSCKCSVRRSPLCEKRLEDAIIYDVVCRAGQLRRRPRPVPHGASGQDPGHPRRHRRGRRGDDGGAVDGARLYIRCAQGHETPTAVLEAAGHGDHVRRFFGLRGARVQAAVVPHRDLRLRWQMCFSIRCCCGRRPADHVHLVLGEHHAQCGALQHRFSNFFAGPLRPGGS